MFNIRADKKEILLLQILFVCLNNLRRGFTLRITFIIRITCMFLK